MNRRDLVLNGLGAVAGVAFAQKLVAAEKKPAAKVHGADHSKLIAAASDCIAKGKVCLPHCIDMMAEGMKGMGECAKSVNEMLALCEGLVALAAANSSHLPKYAALCAEVCLACEKACRKHADHHEVCKACAESCAECAKHCKAVA